MSGEDNIKAFTQFVDNTIRAALEIDEPRNYLAEARKILAGTTMLLTEKRHLEALHEAHEAEIRRTVNTLHDLKMKLLTANSPRG